MNKISQRLSIFVSILIVSSLLAAPLGSMKLEQSTSLETMFTIPDTNIMVHLWEESDDTGDTMTYYTIYNKGIPQRTTGTSYQLGLRYDFFDPLTKTPDIPHLLQSGEDTHLYIVQFFTQPLGEYHEILTSLGGKIYHYIAQNNSLAY